MPNITFPSRTWTDTGIIANRAGTVTVDSPTEGVLYVRVVNAGVVIREIKAWVGLGPVSRDYGVGDSALVWCGSPNSQTLNVTNH